MDIKKFLFENFYENGQIQVMDNFDKSWKRLCK